MTRLTLKEGTSITVNSNEVSEYTFDFNVESKADCIIRIEGDKPLTLNVTGEGLSYSQFSLLILNSNTADVTINDKYGLYEGAMATIAYSQLTNSAVTTNSNYDLLQPMASLKVLSVSITSAKNQFNQNCNHLASQTKAQVDNYGIVLKNGNCQMVVKNTINRGFHDCATHQTSRLLTYDKTAVGKILPILIIDDNEVEASHACSLGQPDENQIYYLMSRGLSYDESLKLITIGYLMPITRIIDDEKINELLASEIEEKVSAYV